MKYRRMLVAVTLLLGFGVAANAETRGVQVSVKLPFSSSPAEGHSPLAHMQLSVFQISHSAYC